ncbi:MAG TPA: SDR family oxidoreductase [Kofleriaceae bacterium]|nr:SDR family oxidoreductase [Kofleriaceae bacterium]
MAKLAGRAALITGASQGLGRAIAEAYVREGASIAICARDAKLLDQVRAELLPLCTTGQKILARPCDVSKREQVQALVEHAVATFPELDILVNSAGVYGPKGPTEDVDWDAWVQAIEIDLFGAVLLCRAIVPHLKRRGAGKIVQLSGGGATQPLARLSAYATAKAAVVRFAETLAVELAPNNIDVNCIAPGALNTRMLDEILEAGPDAVGADFYARSLAQKESGGVPLDKGAALAVFLAAPDSNGITGKLLSAVWDPWEDLPARVNELAGSDIYTLRRIVPGDRGKDWGDK